MLTKIFFNDLGRNFTSYKYTFSSAKGKNITRSLKNYNLIVNLDCGPLRTFYRNSFLQLFISRYAFFSKKIGKLGLPWHDVFLFTICYCGIRQGQNCVQIRYLRTVTQENFPWESKQMRWLLVQVGRYLDQLVIFLVVHGRVRRQVLQVSKVKHMERKIQMKSSTFC